MQTYRIHSFQTLVDIYLQGTIHPKKYLWMIVLAFALLSFGFSKAFAQQPLMDYQVKSAMLYKFLGYSSWPESRFNDVHSPYRIWVLGADDIRNNLQGIVVHRVINDRPIEIYSASSINQIVDAHIVFVSRRMEKFLPKLSRLAEKKSFLIVTESERGLLPGSTINLRTVNERIGFDISLVAAQDYGISLSSRLLSVAISVEEGHQ